MPDDFIEEPQRPHESSLQAPEFCILGYLEVPCTKAVEDAKNNRCEKNHT